MDGGNSEGMKGTTIMTRVENLHSYVQKRSSNSTIKNWWNIENPKMLDRSNTVICLEAQSHVFDPGFYDVVVGMDLGTPRGLLKVMMAF